MHLLDAMYSSVLFRRGCCSDAYKTSSRPVHHMQSKHPFPCLIPWQFLSQVGLGPLRLRAETAAIAMLATLMLHGNVSHSNA